MQESVDQYWRVSPDDANCVVYVGDPMCSWCWGFAPVMDALHGRYGLSVRMVMGGLRSDERAQPLDDGLRTYLRRTWAAVHQATGQPFDFGFLKRRGFLYDTGPACRAVVAVRRLWPDEQYRFFRWLQAQFYAHGGDITVPSVVERYLDQRGLEAHLPLLSQAVADETRRDYALGRELGVSGFPTVFAQIGGRLCLLARGAEQRTVVERRLRKALSG